MQSSSHPRPTDDLQSLYEFCRAITRNPEAEARQQLADAILLHPASQSRLEAACTVVLKHFANRPEIRDDVLQEARVTVRHRLLRRPHVYEDQGYHQFGSWLWSIWLRACRDGWRRCRPSWLDQSSYLDTLASIADSVSPNDQSWTSELVLVVYERGNPLLQRVLLDWLGGLSLRKSAEGLGITKAAVVRLRQRLVTSFHRARREMLE